MREKVQRLQAWFEGQKGTVAQNFSPVDARIRTRQGNDSVTPASIRKLLNGHRNHIHVSVF